MNTWESDSVLVRGILAYIIHTNTSNTITNIPQNSAGLTQ